MPESRRHGTTRDTRGARVRMALAVGAASLVGASLVTGLAHADKLTDAEELFRRGKALMAEKKDREACPLFEESERLDPQMGTLLNVAICHENIGRVASAWGEFRAVEQQARVANRDDRVKLAHDRAAKLEPRLPRLRIVVPPDVRVNGLVVKVDGEAKGEPLWSGVAVDPGVRDVEASAPGKKPLSLKVRVEGEGSTSSVTIPRLEDEPVPPPGASRADPAAEDALSRRRDEPYVASRSRRTKGFIVGGVGLAAVAAGGAFGVLAILKDGDASSACPTPCIEGSPAAGNADDATDRAVLFANVANVAIPVGVLVALVGGYLVLGAGPTSPPRTGTQATRAPRASGFVAPRAGGAAVGLTW